MRRAATPVAEDVVGAPLAASRDHQRPMFTARLDGLDEQARRRFVPSATSLLGLVEHATSVDRVWFDEAVTGRSRPEIGVAACPEESVVLHPDGTVAGVRKVQTAACAASRPVMADPVLDEVVHGYRRGPLPLRWVHPHLLREVAHHCGHADVLREQLLAAPTAPAADVLESDR